MEVHGVTSDYLARLNAVAAEVALPTHAGLDEAIALAEDLVAAELGGKATVEVASQQQGVVRSDVEQQVREMLKEFGLDVPPAEDEAARYRLLLWLFGHAGLPLSAFEGPFYAQLTARHQQSELDRTLMTFLHQRDQLTRPADLDEVESQMRLAVRSLIPKE